LMELRLVWKLILSVEVALSSKVAIKDAFNFAKLLAYGSLLQAAAKVSLKVDGSQHIGLVSIRFPFFFGWCMMCMQQQIKLFRPR